MQAHHIKITTRPGWLPEKFFQQGPCVVKFTFSAAERKVYRRHKPIKPSILVSQKRVLTGGPLKGSTVNYEVSPMSRGFIDISFFPSVRYIVNCKSVQSSGTTDVHSCLAYAALRRPGDAVIAYPDRHLATKSSKDKVQTMIEDSPALKKLMTGYVDDMATMRIKLANMLIYFGWSGSAASLGDTTAMYVIKEEADKWQEFANKDEAGTHDSIDQRTTAFEDECKIWDNCTATTERGHIWKSLNNATEFIFNYWVRCPDCDQYQIMAFGGKDTPFGIKWPNGSEADPVEVRSKKLAVYVCGHCGVEWDDSSRNLASRRGQWRGLPTKEWLPAYKKLKDGDFNAMDHSHEAFAILKKHRPVAVGFHRPAWPSTMVSLSKSAAEFLRGQGSDAEAKKALKSFNNNFAAEPWYHVHQDRDEDKILRLCDDRPAGMVPGDAEYTDPANKQIKIGPQAACLIAGVDVHGDKKGFYVMIIAFGFGMAQDQWLVKHVIVDSFEAVAEVLWAHEYRDAQGRLYPVQKTLIDSGYRTKEVYDFCLQHRGRIQPSKGKQSMAQTHTFSAQEYFPNSTKKLPYGLSRVDINTEHFKDAFSDKLDVDPHAPGSFRLNSTKDKELARQLCSEVKDDKMVWVPVTEGRATHFWDCAILCQVGAEIMGVKHKARPEPNNPNPGRQYKTASSSYLGGR